MRDHSLATLVLHPASERTRSVTIPLNRDRAIRFLRKRMERLSENAALGDGWAQMGLGQTDQWLDTKFRRWADGRLARAHVERD